VKNGFTLVEAVVAVAIIVIAGFSILAAASRCAAVAANVRNHHDAVAVLDLGELDHPYVATNDMDDIEVDPAPYGKFTFSRIVQQMPDEDDFYVVKTRVSWNSKGKQVYEEVETLLFSTNR